MLGDNLDARPGAAGPVEAEVNIFKGILKYWLKHYKQAPQACRDSVLLVIKGMEKKGITIDHLHEIEKALQCMAVELAHLPLACFVFDDGDVDEEMCSFTDGWIKKVNQVTQAADSKVARQALQQYLDAFRTMVEWCIEKEGVGSFRLINITRRLFEIPIQTGTWAKPMIDDWMKAISSLLDEKAVLFCSRYAGDQTVLAIAIEHAFPQMKLLLQKPGVNWNQEFIIGDFPIINALLEELNLEPDDWDGTLPIIASAFYYKQEQLVPLFMRHGLPWRPLYESEREVIEHVNAGACARYDRLPITTIEAAVAEGDMALLLRTLNRLNDNPAACVALKEHPDIGGAISLIFDIAIKSGERQLLDHLQMMGWMSVLPQKFALNSAIPPESSWDGTLPLLACAYFHVHPELGATLIDYGVPYVPLTKPERNVLKVAVGEDGCRQYEACAPERAARVKTPVLVLSEHRPAEQELEAAVGEDDYREYKACVPEPATAILALSGQMAEVEATAEVTACGDL